MKENALDIFVEDPLKELSEEVIQKMPQFDTFDEFAERMLPITRFNAKHRTLLKAVFSFLDHGVYCMTTNMLFYAITGSNERKATDVQRKAIYDLMSDMKSDIVCVGISCKDQMIASVGTALIAEVAIICEKRESQSTEFRRTHYISIIKKLLSIRRTGLRSILFRNACAGTIKN